MVGFEPTQNILLESIVLPVKLHAQVNHHNHNRFHHDPNQL
jgi:hypothetical protein